MTERGKPTWREALSIVAESILAETFRQELPPLRESFGDDPDEIGAIYTGTLIEMFVESAGLFTLELPPEEVPAALAHIRETLTQLDFEEQQAHLDAEERRYYESFAQYAETLFAAVGEGMASLLRCYVAGDYDPEANPNDLIAEALEIAYGGEEELKHAQHLITQAGALALYGRPLWWRWDVEAYGPAAPWLLTIFNLAQDYTGNGESPLGSAEEFRAALQTTRRMAEETRKELEEQAVEELGERPEEAPEPLTAAPSPVDELVEELIEQGEASLTPEQVERCRADRETFIPALIELATDEYLQLEESPGDGYAPIHAAQLLGRLKAAEAVPALIDIVAEVDYDAIIYSAAALALEEIGPPALEPLLDFFRYSWDTDTKTALSDALVEAGRGDERAYEALVELWEEATWDEGKCLVAHSLAELGGERAIPLLEEALADPDMPEMDYNEVAYALEELGVEVPEGPAEPSRFDLKKWGRLALSDVTDPEVLMALTWDAPEEWRDHPDGLAHAYVSSQQESLSRLIALQVLSLPQETSIAFVTDTLEAVRTLTFDASTQDYPDWLQQTYAHLAEYAGPQFQHRIVGMLLSLQHYLSDGYDVADEPDHLLEAARELSPEEEERKMRRLFGQAGALILHGRPLWHRWPEESDHPLSDWLSGVITLRDHLKRVDQIPLQQSGEVEVDKLDILLTDVEEEKEPPPEIAELLDVIIEQGEDDLPLRQRRRFTHRRADLAPYLIEMVKDRQYWWEEGPGGGWAAILAVRLLGELKIVQAADVLIDAVADSHPEDVIHDTALFSLMNIGRLARPAVQTYFRYGRDIETKTSLAEVLGQIGRRGSEDFDFLREVWEAADWEQNRRMVALAFGDLRDRRAIPLLRAALRDPSADALDLDYVHWALQRLSASPPPPPRRPPGLKTPAPFNPRLIYDEFDRPQRLTYNVWGTPLCPDCGRPLEQDERGGWIHP